MGRLIMGQVVTTRGRMAMRMELMTRLGEMTGIDRTIRKYGGTIDTNIALKESLRSPPVTGIHAASLK
jgi:hypothetical protein